MSLLMGVWGWWAFDFFTLIASYLSSSVISAQTIMRSLGLLTFMLPVGLGRATSYYVGVFIGQGCEKSINHYYNVCLAMSAIVGLIQCFILWILEDQVIAFYTNQQDVVDQMHQAWFVFCIFVFFDTT